MGATDHEAQGSDRVMDWVGWGVNKNNFCCPFII